MGTDKPATDKPAEDGPRILAVEEPGPTRTTDAIAPADEDAGVAEGDPTEDGEDDEDAEGDDEGGTDHEPETVPPGDGDDTDEGADQPAEVQP